MPQHVRNYTDHEPKLPPPIYTPEEVTRGILRATAHPVRDITVGSSARTISTFSKLARCAADWLTETMAPVQLGSEPPSTGDNL